MFKYFLASFVGIYLFTFLLISPVKAIGNDLVSASGINSASDKKFVVNFFKDGLPDGDLQSRIIKEDQDFQVSITAYDSSGTNQDTSFFQTGSNYPFYLSGQTRDGGTWNGCVGTLQKGSNNDLFGTIPLGSNVSCTPIKSGSATFGLYAADTHILVNPNNYILKNVPLSIDSTQGGEVASITNFNNDENNKTVCRDRVTKVLLKNASKNKKYTFYWDGAIINKAADDYTPPDDNTVQTIPLTGYGLDFNKTSAKLCMVENDKAYNLTQYFPALSFQACSQSGHFVDFNIKPASDPTCPIKGPICKPLPISINNNTNKYNVAVSVENFTPVARVMASLKDASENIVRSDDKPSSANGDFTFNLGEFAAGTYDFTAKNSLNPAEMCTAKVEVSDKVATGGNPVAPTVIDFKSALCDPKAGPNAENRCANSAGQSCDTATGKPVDKEGNGILTAIGCVPVDTSLFIAGLMKYITGFSGGVALLLMVFGAFQMMTSSGNAENLKKGREQFVSAVIGLLFVIFATLLLQIIGVDILGLPGFKK